MILPCGWLSKDNRHDHVAVQNFVLLCTNILKEAGVNVSRIIMSSDGWSAQYKGKGSFHDLLTKFDSHVKRNYLDLNMANQKLMEELS